jgi:DNA invertase Pin-like site-specific DNA recombinase
MVKSVLMYSKPSINNRRGKKSMAKIYGYARVSTDGQAKNGNSLEVQEKALRDAGAIEVYADHVTGTKMERPKLDELLPALRPGDTLIVTKLDRIARSLSDGNDLVNKLIERKVRVHILNIGMLDNTPASKLIRGIFFAFAEFERDMIISRTQEGKSIARQKPGFTEGRPREYTDQAIAHAVELLKANSYKQVSEMTGMSKSTLQRAKREAGTNGGAVQSDIQGGERKQAPVQGDAGKRRKR